MPDANGEGDSEMTIERTLIYSTSERASRSLERDFNRTYKRMLAVKRVVKRR
jgi:hypothetical protein